MARFLLITHIYPPAVDGGSKIIAKTGEYLKLQEHQVLVLTSNCYTSDNFSKFYKTNLHSTPDIIRLPVLTILHRPLKLISKLFRNFSVFSKGPIFTYLPIKKILSFHPDFILAGPLPTTIVLYVKLICFITKVLRHYRPKVLVIPCFHPNDPDFQNILLKKALSRSDFVIALTETEKKLLGKFTHTNIIVSPLGVDPDFLINANQISFPKNPNILFIGNFSAHKRFELLIDAFIRLQKIYPQLSLTALGQKTLYWPVIENKIQSTGCKIKFIFNPTRDQLKKAIDVSTMLCLPSIHESFGLVFIESLARGKPVIGANTPQTSEVLNLIQGGITFKTDNLPDLISKLKFLISHPAHSQKLGTKGHRFVKNHFTWDKIEKNLWTKIFSS